MTDIHTPVTQDSFLHEAQRAGKATGKIELQHLDKALDEVCDVMNHEVVELYKTKDESEWPRSTMKVYCQDCREIVPPGIMELRRGRTRTVCGKCRSKKIARGREEALMGFYRIDKKKSSEKLSEEVSKEPSKETPQKTYKKTYKKAPRK